MPAGPNQTPRVGPIGVLSATGSMLYRDANGNVTDVVPGTAGQILTLNAALVPDWQNPSLAVDVFQDFWSMDALFAAINGVAGIAAVGVRNLRGELLFDDSTDENVVFCGVMPDDYDIDNALEVRIDWAAPAGIIVNDVKWNATWERMDIGGLDIDTNGFAAIQTTTTVTAGATGQLARTVISFSNVQTGSVAAGEDYRLQIVRDADDVGDTLVGDASVLRVSIAEV